MLNKDIAKLDDNFLFVTFIAIVHLIWFDFEIWLFVKVLPKFTVGAFCFDVNAVVGSVVEVIFIITQLLSQHILYLSWHLLLLINLRYLPINLLNNNPIIFLNCLSSILFFNFWSNVDFFICVRDYFLIALRNVVFFNLDFDGFF